MEQVKADQVIGSVTSLWPALSVAVGRLVGGLFFLFKRTKAGLLWTQSIVQSSEDTGSLLYIMENLSKDFPLSFFGVLCFEFVIHINIKSKRSANADHTAGVTDSQKDGLPMQENEGIQIEVLRI